MSHRSIRRGAGLLLGLVAGLCIARLGHLHHLLAPAHREALGRIDVVPAPVDGSCTLDLEGRVETLTAIHPLLAIPMHYFSAWGPERFPQRLGREREVDHAPLGLGAAGARYPAADAEGAGAQGPLSSARFPLSAAAARA